MERQTVSGWWTRADWAWVNQVWNWVKGEGSSWERSREPFVYWSACLVVGSEVGATVEGEGLVEWWWATAGCRVPFERTD